MNEISMTPVDRRVGFYGSFPRRSMANTSRKLFDLQNIEETPGNNGLNDYIMGNKSFVPLEDVAKLDQMRGRSKNKPIKSLLGRRSKTLSPVSMKEDFSHPVLKSTLLPTAVYESCLPKKEFTSKLDLLLSTKNRGPRTRSQVKKELETFVIKTEKPHKKMSTIDENVTTDPYISEVSLTSSRGEYRSNCKDSIDLFIYNETMIAETCKKDDNNTNREPLQVNSITSESSKMSLNSCALRDDDSARKVLSSLANLVFDLHKEKKEFDSKLSSFIKQKETFDIAYANTIARLENLKVLNSKIH